MAFAYLGLTMDNRAGLSRAHLAAMSRFLVSLCLLTSCGNVMSNALPDGGPSDDAATDADGDAPDASEPAPSIATALDCGTAASAGGLRKGTDLQRVDIDLALFPAARCNDGTAGTFYFRPASTAAGARRWVIQLQGGGSCSNPDDCARRWCSVDTNFGMTQMTDTLAPTEGIVADGILYRGTAVATPIADANQVFIRYCSSDAWAGRTGPLDVDAVHPVTGDPLRYRIDFHGEDILDAVIAMLRREGATVPAYTINGGADALADLDTATNVLLAGASGGGAGTIFNADRIGALLHANNVCGADCALDYVALMDSIFAPRGDALDWSTSTQCTQLGACTFEQVLATARSLFSPQGDESCASWHATNAPGTAYLCNDPGHVIRNHVVTPMLVRMGLLDQLIGGNMIESGVTVPGQGPMNAERFATLVHDQLVDLSRLPALAEEGAQMKEPATFGPPCPDHETLSSNDSTFGVTVTAAGAPRTMFDIAGAWRAHATPIHAVWDQGDPIDCGL
jgi:hypothetical protein